MVVLGTRVNLLVLKYADVVVTPEAWVAGFVDLASSASGLSLALTVVGGVTDAATSCHTFNVVKPTTRFAELARVRVNMHGRRRLAWNYFARGFCERTV